ncbi:hypothetical protein BS47DRAFT_1006126 [Hydnum rufescens UP504]|uniref:Uncharacterized protein n=1 Tax=Hydnum rufescens UP504 TaxID=1448309 RepID=A0A9P6DZV4_9AGAM|nr:hypothetical protein BS47DRAFT_1006126 [Hydnum rufescens UP504]
MGTLLMAKMVLHPRTHSRTRLIRTPHRQLPLLLRKLNESPRLLLVALTFLTTVICLPSRMAGLLRVISDSHRALVIRIRQAPIHW